MIQTGTTSVAAFTNERSGYGAGGGGDSHDHDDDDNNEINVTVQKKWKLDDGGIKPESIRVELLRNNRHYDWMELSEENNWRYTWQNLNNRYDWSVREEAPEGFTAKTSRSRNLDYHQ